MTKAKKLWRHFCTVLRHKAVVYQECRACGIGWQGLIHDLSKFSPAEFGPSARYFQGDRSPIEAEKETVGYSNAWLHHKAHNKHHWEYWTDFFQGRIICCTMPWKYATELVCDMLSASKTYQPEAFSGQTCLEYFEERKDSCYMSKATKLYVEWCLKEYAENGWKNLGKKNTKAKYEAITKEHPKFEVFEELRNGKPLPDWQKQTTGL